MRRTEGLARETAGSTPISTARSKGRSFGRSRSISPPARPAARRSRRGGASPRRRSRFRRSRFPTGSRPRSWPGSAPKAARKPLLRRPAAWAAGAAGLALAGAGWVLLTGRSFSDVVLDASRFLWGNVQGLATLAAKSYSYAALAVKVLGKLAGQVLEGFKVLNSFIGPDVQIACLCAALAWPPRGLRLVAAQTPAWREIMKNHRLLVGIGIATLAGVDRRRRRPHLRRRAEEGRRQLSRRDRRPAGRDARQRGQLRRRHRRPGQGPQERPRLRRIDHDQRRSGRRGGGLRLPDHAQGNGRGQGRPRHPGRLDRKGPRLARGRRHGQFQELGDLLEDLRRGIQRDFSACRSGPSSSFSRWSTSSSGCCSPRS